MPDPSKPAGSSGRWRSSAPPWLRLASVCVVLIVVPVGLYLFLYQRSRIEDATIRNFRVLDAAGDRVGEVLLRLSSVVDSSSFGIPPAMLDEVTKRLTGDTAGTPGCGGATRSSWRRPPFPHDLLRLRRPTAAERLEFRYWLAAHTLFERRTDPGTEALWNQLHCLIDTHRKFSAPGQTVSAEVNPFPRMALAPWGPACANAAATSTCIRLRELFEAEPCGALSPRLIAGRDGMEATVADCRRLDERSGNLHRALERFEGSEGVIRAIDLFGTRSAANLDELMKEATGYLSRFFDSHLIADANGLILFEAEAEYTSEMEVDESQVETPSFSSYADISALLRAESPRLDSSGAVERLATAGVAAPRCRRHRFAAGPSCASWATKTSACGYSSIRSSWTASPSPPAHGGSRGQAALSSRRTLRPVPPGPRSTWSASSTTASSGARRSGCGWGWSPTPRSCCWGC